MKINHIKKRLSFEAHRKNNSMMLLSKQSIINFNDMAIGKGKMDNN